MSESKIVIAKCNCEDETFDIDKAIEITPEELRQIKISLAVRIDVIENEPMATDFQSQVEYLKALLKKLETIL